MLAFFNKQDLLFILQGPQALSELEGFISY